MVQGMIAVPSGRLAASPRAKLSSPRHTCIDLDSITPWRPPEQRLHLHQGNWTQCGQADHIGSTGGHVIMLKSRKKANAESYRATLFLGAFPGNVTLLTTILPVSRQRDALNNG